MNSKTMVMAVSNSLNVHILEKIDYHQKLLDAALEVEQYRACAKHHKEIERLKIMLEPQSV